MNSATLSLFSTGSCTGLVVESGHALTNIVPIFEGFPISHAIYEKSLIAGDEMNKVLKRLLKERGLDLDTEIIKDIKEKMCFTARNYEIEVQNFLNIKTK